MAVAIVSFNTRDLLRGVIDSAYADGATEIIVADNGSTDGSVAMLRAEYPSVVIVEDHSNPGYGAASNQAIARAHADYVFLLNSDIVFPAGTLSTLSDYLDAHPAVGIVGPRLMNTDGTLQPSCHEFPRPVVSLLEHSWVGDVVGKVPVIRGRYLRTWSHDQARPVPWVTGAALAIRKSAFDHVRGFDAAFHMYFEEVDLSYRMMRAGWETHFAPVANVTHFGGQSTQYRRTAMFTQYYRSAIQFYERHRTAKETARARRMLRFGLRSKLIIGAARRRMATDPAKKQAIADFMADCTLALKALSPSPGASA